MPALRKDQLRTRRQDRARRDRQDAKARRICTDAVWARQGDAVEGWGNCELCLAFVLRASESHHNLGHVDEILPRSLGGDSTDPANCRLLCHDCHFSGPSGAHRLTDREAVRRILERELPL